MARDFRQVDPAELRLPNSRSGGADPYKLQRQVAKFGDSVAGMPPLLAYEGADGVLELFDGVTRSCKARPRDTCASGGARKVAAAQGPESQDRRWLMIQTSARSPTNLVERIAEVHAQCPELRFGQFLATIGNLAEDETGHSLWDVEDVEFLAALERFASDLARRDV